MRGAALRAARSVGPKTIVVEWEIRTADLPSAAMAVLNSVLEAIVTVVCLLETHRALVHAPTPRRARTRAARDWGRSDVRTERGDVRRVGSVQRRARIAEALCTLGVWSAYLCVRPLITGVLAWFIPFCSTIQMVWLLWMLANHRSASYLLFAHGIRPVLRRHEAWVDSTTLWVHGLLLFLARVVGLVAQKSTPVCVKRGLQRGADWGATVYAYVQSAWQRQGEQSEVPKTPKRAKTQSKGAQTPGQGKTPNVPGLYVYTPASAKVPGSDKKPKKNEVNESPALRVPNSEQLGPRSVSKSEATEPSWVEQEPATFQQELEAAEAAEVAAAVDVPLQSKVEPQPASLLSTPDIPHKRKEPIQPPSEPHEPTESQNAPAPASPPVKPEPDLVLPAQQPSKDPLPNAHHTPPKPRPSARRVRASESVSLDSPRPTPRAKRSLRQASPTHEHRLGESLRERAPSPPRKRRTRRTGPVEPVAEPEQVPSPADHSEPNGTLKRSHASEPPSDTPLSAQPKRARRSTQSARRVAASPAGAPRPLEARRPSTRAQTSRRTPSQTSLLPRPMRTSMDDADPPLRRSNRAEAAHSDTPVPRTTRRAP